MPTSLDTLTQSTIRERHEALERASGLPAASLDQMLLEAREESVRNAWELLAQTGDRTVSEGDANDMLALVFTDEARKTEAAAWTSLENRLLRFGIHNLKQIDAATGAVIDEADPTKVDREGQQKIRAAIRTKIFSMPEARFAYETLSVANQEAWIEKILTDPQFITNLSRILKARVGDTAQAATLRTDFDQAEQSYNQALTNQHNIERKIAEKTAERNRVRPAPGTPAVAEAASAAYRDEMAKIDSQIVKTERRITKATTSYNKLERNIKDRANATNAGEADLLKNLQTERDKVLGTIKQLEDRVRELQAKQTELREKLRGQSASFDNLTTEIANLEQQRIAAEAAVNSADQARDRIKSRRAGYERDKIQQLELALGDAAGAAFANANREAQAYEDRLRSKITDAQVKLVADTVHDRITSGKMDTKKALELLSKRGPEGFLNDESGKYISLPKAVKAAVSSDPNKLNTFKEAALKDLFMREFGKGKRPSKKEFKMYVDSPYVGLDTAKKLIGETETFNKVAKDLEKNGITRENLLARMAKMSKKNFITFGVLVLGGALAVGGTSFLAGLIHPELGKLLSHKAAMVVKDIHAAGVKAGTSLDTALAK